MFLLLDESALPFVDNAAKNELSVLNSHQETVLNIQQKINILNFLKLSTAFFQILARTAFSSICKTSKKAYHFSSVSGTKEPIIKGRSRKEFHISQAVSYTLKELREVTFKISGLLVLSMVEYENV